MGKALVIVESPAKAKTIAGILGRDFLVESSIGHIRDLPGNATEIPAAYKGEAWARLGVDVDNDFKPLYVVSSKKKQQVKRLKDLMKGADELYLATDEDREGESIAWHLLEVLNPTIPVKRMVFHEITKEAVMRAARIRASSTGASSTPRRRAASSIVSTATRSPRCCGARSCRGCRRDGCNRSPPGSSSSGARADALHPGRLLGHRRVLRRR
jgi:DNA topoisomerase IA